MQTEKFSPLNPDNISHLPMACDLATWDNVTLTDTDHQMYDCDISFVGSLYSEKRRYNTIENSLSDYTKGYVEGLISAQLNVYGYNF